MSSIDPESCVPNLFWSEGWVEEGTDPNPSPYQGPPPGIRPGRASLALTLGESGRAIVLLTTVKAYPTGVTFIVSCLLKNTSAGDIADPIADGRILLTLELPDGHHLSGTDPLPEYEYLAELRARPDHPRDDQWLPAHPVLRRLGAGADAATFEQAYWLWPLPPTGLITVRCHWLEHDIATTESQIDVQLLLDAAATATRPPR